MWIMMRLFLRMVIGEEREKQEERLKKNLKTRLKIKD